MLTTKTRRHEDARLVSRNWAVYAHSFLFKSKEVRCSTCNSPASSSWPSCLRVFVFNLVLFSIPTFADDPPEKPDSAALASKQAYDRNLAQFKDNADYFVLPGLLANRKDKTVRLY